MKSKLQYEVLYDNYIWVVYIGDRNISFMVKFFTKPTQKQLRKLVKAWKYEISLKNFKSLWYKKYDTIKGKFIN